MRYIVVFTIKIKTLLNKLCKDWYKGHFNFFKLFFFIGGSLTKKTLPIFCPRQESAACAGSPIVFIPVQNFAFPILMIV